MHLTCWFTAVWDFRNRVTISSADLRSCRRKFSLQYVKYLSRRNLRIMTLCKPVPFLTYLSNNQNYQSIRSERFWHIFFKNLPSILGADSGWQTDNKLIHYSRRTFLFYQEILKAKETITPYSVLEFYRHFRVKHCVHFHYTRMSLKAKIFKYMSRFFCVFYIIHYLSVRQVFWLDCSSQS